MKARTLADLLRAGDRVVISNVTGREASKVTEATQRYCGNVCAGWALGKGGQEVKAESGPSVPVFSDFKELMTSLPVDRKPNKVVVYSPPEAVYGEVKEVCAYGGEAIETIFIITEHVSIEVTAKINQICAEAGIDVIGCNTLGLINVHEATRVGAVGGDYPGEAFTPGSVTIISNSGNMVNTMASYLGSAGMGVSFGCSTGKDPLILTPPKEFMRLATHDPNTKVVVLYIEPGGLYEQDLIDYMVSENIDLPMVVYIAGCLAEGRDLSLGHAGAVVEGPGTSASGKIELFDEYFGVGPFDANRGVPRTKKSLDPFRRGIRITALHHLPRAVALVRRARNLDRDFRPQSMLKLNPWFLDLGKLERYLPRRLVLDSGTIPKLYADQVKRQSKHWIGADLPRRDMRGASHASSNDGALPRIYGRDLTKLMREGSFGRALIIAWTGEEPPHSFDGELVERCLIAAMTNGPGTISAQGAKLSASAGNAPNTAMIATLASIGTVHGGNGAEAVRYLVRIFRDTELYDPYENPPDLDLDAIVRREAERFVSERAAAKEAGTQYRRIPCMGHPVYKDRDVNYDPREVVVSEFLESKGVSNLLLDFYHRLALMLRDMGVSKRAWAVNVDAAIACVWLGITWPLLRDKRITFERAVDIPFLAFALGRVAGGAAEFLDHKDYGTPMDMRIPASEGRALVKPRD